MDRKQKEQIVTGIIRQLGTSLKSRGLYPPSHPLVRTPVEKCHADILLFFAERQELALAISDGTLVLEGVPIFSLTSSLEFFVGRLGKIGVPAIVFEKGVTYADIEIFIRFLHETKEQDLPAREIQDRLKAMGVAHIRVRPTEEDEEDDLLIAREIYNNAVSVVASVLADIKSGRIPSGSESERVVREMSTMLKRNRDAMLALTLIKNFDEYTYNHSVNVSVLALALADAMQLPDGEKLEVGVAGLLHDVGKTQLALNLIRKPGALTAEEFEEVKKHPAEGFVLLGKMSHIRPDTAFIVREHHMRFDRTGYPRPEPGYRTNPYSQVIAVADCYDALTTMRSYQKARTPLQSLVIMEKLAGTSLAPEIVAMLAKSLGSYPVGTMVRLNSMEVGVVTGGSSDGRGPLKVIVLFDRAGVPLARPEQIAIEEPGGKEARRPRTILGTVNPLLYRPTAADAYLPAASA